MAIDASEERLSKYELIRPLGSGGMGEVYLARDRVLQRQVAIKFVSSKHLNEPGAERRLVREARAAAALDHPAICPVYDVVGTDDRTCIVMQYVDGETLAARLKRGALEPTEAVVLALRIAEALVAAHAAGIVHRDLKPQNIVLMLDGRPKLLDFGIAQAEPPPEVVASLETHTATDTVRTGAIVGTPAYMSPEQVLRKPVDGRSDLFSLGAVLYECLTGQPAFLAATDVETWARVVYATPPAASSINPAVTPPIDAVVARLLEKHPSERFASAADAVTALRALGLGETEGRLSRRQLMIAIASVVAAAALTGFVAWRTTRPRPLPPPSPEAEKWYLLGTENLRDGTYSSAKRALEEARRLSPDFPQALERLAEAQNELDEGRGAAATVLHLAEILPDPSRVKGVDGVRLSAVMALVQLDREKAIAAYKKIADLSPADRGAWLDLSRAQYAGNRRTEALASAEKALQIDPQYAAGHLRRAMVLADLRRRDEALKEFDEAERLYRVASNVEGQTETLYRRARFLNGNGDKKAARSVIDTATALAQQSGNHLQQVQLALLSSNVMVVMGDVAGAERIASAAIDMARRNGLDVAAADGLTDVATVLSFKGEIELAAANLRDAIDLAERLDAKRVKARATLQLASLYESLGKPHDAINLAEGQLDFVRRTKDKSLELNALSILARAREDLGDYAEAQQLARDMYSAAESMHDDSQIEHALDSLAGTAAALGSLPEALRFQRRLKEIHETQQQNTLLAYDLANIAELLVRLGRLDEAKEPLDQIQAGIAARVDAFVRRERRATAVRALAASIQSRFEDAVRDSDAVLNASRGETRPNSSSSLAAVLRARARARLHLPADEADRALAYDNTLPIATLAELRYWRGCARLEQRRPGDALAEATVGLAALDKTPSAELEWRLAALGSAAARQLHDVARAEALATRAAVALARVRQGWGNDVLSYEQRPDLIEIRKAAGLS
jgi:tetratricopeptide (TPR) repeat protein/tRNA A-37 threonylcarbamoyl transferase component Bud32